ncbi:MAG: hypothetical protein LBP65_01290 [Puniceicoccales bacterium]|jgi:hypothetical protein|nr:hypothetical protein [Puniceicoccales bacterium]
MSQKVHAKNQPTPLPKAVYQPPREVWQLLENVKTNSCDIYIISPRVAFYVLRLAGNGPVVAALKALCFLLPCGQRWLRTILLQVLEQHRKKVSKSYQIQQLNEILGQPARTPILDEICQTLHLCGPYDVGIGGSRPYFANGQQVCEMLNGNNGVIQGVLHQEGTKCKFVSLDGKTTKLVTKDPSGNPVCEGHYVMTADDLKEYSCAFRSLVAMRQYQTNCELQIQNWRGPNRADANFGDAPFPDGTRRGVDDVRRDSATFLRNLLRNKDGSAIEIIQRNNPNVFVSLNDQSIDAIWNEKTGKPSNKLVDAQLVEIASAELCQAPAMIISDYPDKTLISCTWPSNQDRQSVAHVFQKILTKEAWEAANNDEAMLKFVQKGLDDETDGRLKFETMAELTDYLAKNKSVAGTDSEIVHNWVALYKVNPTPDCQYSSYTEYIAAMDVEKKKFLEKIGDIQKQNPVLNCFYLDADGAHFQPMFPEPKDPT